MKQDKVNELFNMFTNKQNIENNQFNNSLTYFELLKICVSSLCSITSAYEFIHTITAPMSDHSQRCVQSNQTHAGK